MGVPSVVGDGSQWISWIHTDDIVAIYNHAIDQNLKGIYNAVAPVAIKNKEFTKSVAGFYKIPMWAPNIPGFIAKIIFRSNVYASATGAASKCVQSWRVPGLHSSIQP